MKMRIFLLLVLIATTAAVPCEAKKKDKTSPEQKGLQTISIATAKAHVEFLASDALMGREAGTGHGQIAGEYLISILKLMGGTPLFEEGFGQPFTVYSAERRDAQFTVDPMKIERLKKKPHRTAPMRNILAKIDGKNPEEIVVVGAHYDHLGYDPLLQGDKIFNGADDNASGVQAVLQILKAFMATGEQPEKTVIFAFWDGEEKGLFGSKYFVQNFPEIKRVKGYMNFDMIGRNNMEHRPQQLKYLYLAEDSIYATWLKEDIKKYSLALDPDFLPSDDLSGGSDQVPFFNAGVSIVWYHTDGHPDYHMPSDHAERINWDKMVDITKAAFLCLWKMANKPLP